jgi:predicted amidohydrolase YtcJ
VGGWYGMSTLLLGAEGGDIRVAADRIVAVGRLRPLPGEDVLAVRGGAVLPGLHDHHVHLRALAAAGQSLDLGVARSPAEVDRLVSRAAAGLGRGAWLRAVGWYEGTGGALDRDRLDRLAGSVPVRVQHRGGALWVLNSAGLAAAGAGERAERDQTGRSTGRLWRQDEWLRGRVEPATDAHAVVRVAAEGLRRGITGYTDATPGYTTRDVAALTGLGLPQRLLVMAEPDADRPPGELVGLGPVKVLLDDVDLPAPDLLRRRVEAAHRAGRPVAVHCVSADQLALTLGVLEDAGTVGGDRIEHAGVVPPGFAARMRALTVVTQPGFVRERGDSYLDRVPREEQPWLYPCASLLAAGVATAAGTDAPYGSADPWVAVAAATDRRTAAGRTLNAAERVDARTALGLFLGQPLRPGVPRTVAPGQPPDLCVLRVPLADALAEPSAGHVRGAVVAGRAVWWAER